MRKLEEVEERAKRNRKSAPPRGQGERTMKSYGGR